MTSQLLSFVLPITLKENFEALQWRAEPDNLCMKRFQILLKSFLQTFHLDELSQFLIICPPSDEEVVLELLRSITMDPRFQVMNELDIFPELKELRKRGTDIPGWYIQQIIKIAAAKVFSTNYYLTLDNDIICRKPFSTKDLIPGGKALLNIETIGAYLRIYKTKIALHEWKIKRQRLRSSAQLLGYKRKWRYLYQSYGETPVLMHRDSVKELISFLEKRHGSWSHCLTQHHGWTEYALFFQFLEMNGHLNRFYQKGNHNTVLDLESSVWKNNDHYKHRRDFSPEFILDYNNVRSGIFVAIQSYLSTDNWLPDKYSELSEFYSDIENHLINSGKVCDLVEE